MSGLREGDAGERPRAGAPHALPAIGHLHLDLTNHCNFKCEFCFHFGDLTARRGFMDRALALRLIDEVADKGLASELATSVFGEALLHPDWQAIVEHAVARGLGVTLNTKGGLLDAEVSRRIVAAGVKKLIISLNTPDEPSYKINHPPSSLDYAGHLDKIRSAIAAKLAARSPIHIYLYLMNTHFARPRGLTLISDPRQAVRAVGFWRDECAALARAHGLPEPAPAEALVRGDLVRRKWPIDRGIELLPGVELVLKEAHSWANRILDPRFEAVPTTTGYCPLPWTMLTVHWDGDCSLCCLDYNKDVVIGNVKESSIEAVFAGGRMQAVRAGFERNQVVESLCQRCLGGLRDRETGEMVRAPQGSPVGRLVGQVRKYGLRESARFALEEAGARLRGGDDRR